MSKRKIVALVALGAVVIAAGIVWATPVQAGDLFWWIRCRYVAC